MFHHYKNCPENIHEKSEEIEDLLLQLRNIFFPELKGYTLGGHLGIFNPKSPMESKLAYDIIQVLERALYHANKKSDKKVWAHRCEYEPLKSGNEEFPEVIVDKNTK